VYYKFNQYILIALLPYCLSSIVSAQTKFSRRCEYFGGIGTSHFLGDLGGSNNVGTNLLNDLNPSTTGIAFTSGIRYKRYPELSFKSILTLAWVSGNDNRTNEPFRKN
jgi:hypothetical protein